MMLRMKPGNRWNTFALIATRFLAGMSDYEPAQGLLKALSVDATSSQPDISSAMPITSVEFKPSTVRPEEQADIRQRCIKAGNHPALQSSSVATVYSYKSTWWHKNDDGDPKEHITVRYDRRDGNRVHIYKDNTIAFKPARNLLSATVGGLEGPQRVDDEGSDGTVEFSDEEGLDIVESTDN
ncbi:hypothetical protein DFH06DRAFT_1427938 [Mycena polygramma]|nr:hypothetical protein DFH06DRAFT_1427938 [Mycena polygramma]